MTINMFFLSGHQYSVKFEVVTVYTYVGVGYIGVPFIHYSLGANKTGWFRMLCSEVLHHRSQYQLNSYRCITASRDVQQADQNGHKKQSDRYRIAHRARS